MRRQRRRAYTLMEVMLVMAVMVMMAALGYRSIDSLYSGVKVEAASDAVRAAWAEAQARAVSEGRPYRFSVVPGKGNYRYAPDSADFWSGSTPEMDPENPSIIVAQSLPKGIVFTGRGEGAAEDDESSFPDNEVNDSLWVTTAVFLPDGTAQDDADITVRMVGNNSVRPINLSLRSLTGVTSVQRGEDQ